MDEETRRSGQHMPNLVKFILYHIKLSPKFSPKDTQDAILKMLNAMIEPPPSRKMHRNKFLEKRHGNYDFSLQDVFEALTRDYHFPDEETAGRCLDLMQSIANMTEDHHDWSYLSRNPVYTIFGLLHYIDYFWKDAKRKEQVASLLRWFLEMKVQRPLRDEEVRQLGSKLRDSFPLDERGIITVSP